MAAIATRREKVVLDLEDNFTAGMLRASAAASLLDKNLGHLDKSSVRAEKSTTRMGDSSGRSFNKIEQNAKRAERSSSLLVDSIAMLAPTVVPLSAAAVPAIAGLTSQLGFAAGAAGVAVLAFHGIGDALKAVDTYNVEPTAEHLAKMREEMQKIGPAGAQFVRELEKIKGQLKPIQDAARAGLFPGLTQGIEELTSRIPVVQRIVSQIATESGTLFGQAGKSLAGPEWDKFFAFLEREAAPTLQSLGETIGNLALTAANLWVAFEPLETSFSAGLVSATGKLKAWSDGLSKTQGFRDFIDYVQKSGPQVAEALGSLANAFVQVVQAAAPIGGPILKVISTLADLIAAIANSPIGSDLFVLAAGLAAVNRAMTIGTKVQDSLIGNLILGKDGKGGRGPSGITKARTSIRGLADDIRTANSLPGIRKSFGLPTADEMSKQAAASGRLGDRLKTLGKGSAAIAGLTLATTGLADGMGVSNTASLALMGTMGGPWGALAGGVVGAFQDMSSAGKSLGDAMKAADDAMDPSSGSIAQREEVLRQLAKQSKALDNASTWNLGADFAKTKSLLTGQVNAPTRQFNDLKGQLDKEKAQALALRDARTGANNLTLLKEGFVTTAAGAKAAGEGIGAFTARISAMEDLLTRRAGARSYQQSIDDMTKSLKTNGKTLDINTDKGRQNQAALDNIANSAIAYAKTLGPIQRVKFMDNARKGFIAATEAAGRTKAQAKALADRLIGVGQLKPNPKVDIRDAQAKNKINSLNSQLDYLARTRVAHIGVTLAGVAAANAALVGLTRPRTAPVKAGHKDGSWISGPGGPRDDLVPIMASPGEFMVNARAASMYPSELEWINAQGLRNGGWSGNPSISMGGPSINANITANIDGLHALVASVSHATATAVLNDHLDMSGARGQAGNGQ